MTPGEGLGLDRGLRLAQGYCKNCGGQGWIDTREAAGIVCPACGGSGKQTPKLKRKVDMLSTAWPFLAVALLGLIWCAICTSRSDKK